jgi:hypothetical protein
MTQAVTTAGEAEFSAADLPSDPVSAIETFWAERKARLRRRRLAGFAVCVPLWALSVVPLARESLEGRDGAGALAVYLVVGALTLGVAAVVRGLYVLLTKRRILSPWVFVMAAGVALVGLAVQGAGEVPAPVVQALESTIA